MGGGARIGGAGGDPNCESMFGGLRNSKYLLTRQTWVRGGEGVQQQRATSSVMEAESRSGAPEPEPGLKNVRKIGGTVGSREMYKFTTLRSS